MPEESVDGKTGKPYENTMEVTALIYFSTHSTTLHVTRLRAYLGVGWANWEVSEGGSEVQLIFK